MALRASPAARAIAAGLLLTMALGLYLRWFLAGVGVPFPTWTTFPFLRHAHSHLGYYAVLLPLAWVAWTRRGVRALSPREAWGYAAFTVVATVGFVQAGYGALGIIGSTVVGGLWVLAALRGTRAANGADDPLLPVLLGTIAALACIPVIAVSLRRDPALAAAAVQSFLALLLFLVAAPSALTALAMRQPVAWAYAAAGVGAGLALGVWDHVVTRIALATLGGFWLVSAGRMPTSPLRAAWALAALGLVGLALGLLPNARDVAVAAVHFLVLGPLLMALARSPLAAHVTDAGWWLHLAATAGLSAPLLLRALGAAPRPSAIASAVGGSLVLLWWVVVLAQWASMSTRRPPAART